ncbi:unnamed protein product [Cladocopium goreaui]|uniref:Uncharacterized protein n=1 Tax=Cladocopium goreaui TaxID=2562237 RepID=A0A9P1CMG3_9DINO|nr:unnamed protein product [Cladocopium goreaui]
MALQKGTGPDKRLFFNMLKLRRTGVPKMPWDTGVAAEVFKKGPISLPMPWLSLPTVGKRESLQGLVPSAEPPERTASRTPFHKRRLLKVRLAQTDDQLRAKAMRRLRDLILAMPSHTQLGRALLDTSGQLTGEDMISCVFADAFRSRATATLVKRSLDYYKMALWMNQHLGLQPMQLTESVVYRYLSFLRETNAAPTLADATVKAIWFMHSTANIVDFNPKVFTSRIAGVCRDLYLRKRILRQAPPFPADVVRALEEYALHAENRVDSMFTNFILFCIFSSCRIGDAAKIREVEFSRYHDIFLVEAATSEAKNTNTMERRRMLLPFTAIGWGLHLNPWCIKWEMQLKAMQPETIMPAFSEVSGQFLKRRITTAEANLWLREENRDLLPEPEEPPQPPGDWAASESDVSEEESFVEGCNFVGNQSTPANTVAGPKLVHRDSLVVHVKRDNQTLWCGRKLSRNYRQWQEGDPDLAQLLVCQQCDKTAVEALLGRAVTPQEMVLCRRLYFEGRTYAASDMQARIDRSADDKPRAMPLAERMARIERQKGDLVGVTWTAELEPSHKLVDKIVAMQEEGALLFIPPHACVSRVQEIHQEKHEVALTFDSGGNIRMGKKAEELKCDTNGDLNLRNAWTRRNLAYDQAGLASFVVLEKWTTKLMLAKLKEPPSGYRYITTQQICECDKEMWLQLSQLSRGRLQPAAPDIRPLDVLIEQITTSPEVLCFLTPLPSAKRDASDHADTPRPKKPKPSPGGPSAPAKPTPKTSDQRMAACILQKLASGPTFLNLKQLRLDSLQAQGRQHRALQQLVPDFEAFHWLPVDAKPAANEKPLPPKTAGEELEVAATTQSEGCGLKVGVWMEPEAHIARALQLCHPMDTTIVLPDPLKKTLFSMLTKEPAVLARERLEMLKLYRDRAADLRVAEAGRKTDEACQRWHLNFGGDIALPAELFTSILDGAPFPQLAWKERSAQGR